MTPSKVQVSLYASLRTAVNRGTVTDAQLGAYLATFRPQAARPESNTEQLVGDKIKFAEAEHRGTGVAAGSIPAPLLGDCTAQPSAIQLRLSGRVRRSEDGSSLMQELRQTYPPMCLPYRMGARSKRPNVLHQCCRDASEAD